MKTLQRWLIISNGDDIRVVKTNPGRTGLSANEVAVEVVINVPTPPRIVGSVTIDLPDPPPATAEAVAIEYGDEESEDDD